MEHRIEDPLNQKGMILATRKSHFFSKNQEMKKKVKQIASGLPLTKLTKLLTYK